MPVPPLYMLLDLLFLIISVTYYINTSFHATYILCIQSCVLIEEKKTMSEHFQNPITNTCRGRNKKKSVSSQQSP